MAPLTIATKGLAGAIFFTTLLSVQGCSPEAGQAVSDRGQTAAATADDKRYQEVASQLLQQRLLPDFEDHAKHTAALRKAVTESCNVSSEGEAKQTELEQAWVNAYLSWQKINFLLFGPLNEEGALRLQFYPDTRQLVPARVKKLLQQPESITPEAIAIGTAPAQGYPALEQLIFAIPVGTPNRCQFMQSIAAFINDRSTQLHKQWLVEADTFTYDGKEAIGRTVDSLQRSINRIYDRRLAEPLGLRGPMKDGKPLSAVPEAAEAGLAKQSLSGIVTTLQSTQAWVTGVQRLANTEAQRTYFVQLNTSFEDVIAALQSASLPLVAAVASNPEPLLAILHGPLGQLKAELSKLNDVLDVYTGFNADDGD